MTRKELIEFLHDITSTIHESEKERVEAKIIEFANGFEFAEKEVEKEVGYLPPHYIAAMPDAVQEEIKEKVIAALTEVGECTPENIERAMCSKIYDLEDLIDVREYIKKMEEEQRKKSEQKRRVGRC